MKREIKFRGKNSETKQWVCGDLLHVGNGFIITINSELGETLPNNEYIGLAYRPDEIAVVIPETIGQFTGLLDNNGNEIHEGDIVRNKEVGGYGLEYIGVVRYYEEDCRFGIDLTATNKFTKRKLFTIGECSFNDGNCTIKYYNEYEVLGNIHDNHELLKAETP